MTVEDLEDAVSSDEVFRQYISMITGEDGAIVPSPESLEVVKRQYADRPDAEKWRLAQADTMVDLFKRYKKKELPGQERRN